MVIVQNVIGQNNQNAPRGGKEDQKMPLCGKKQVVMFCGMNELT